MSRRYRIAATLLVVALLAGCSGRRSNVSGTIRQNGQPLAASSEQGLLLVIFIPEDRKSDPNLYRAETDRTAGTYRLGEVRAGKYRVAVQQFDEKNNDALGHLYDPAKTTLQCEVTEDNQVIDIDVP